MRQSRLPAASGATGRRRLCALALERPLLDEGAALEAGRRIAPVEDRLARLGRGAKLLRAVLRPKAEVRRRGVVPPGRRVVGDAVDDAAADDRRGEAGDDEALEVVVAEPGGEHAAVLRFGERRADAQAHRLDAVAVEVEAGDVLAERLAEAVVAVGPHRRGRVDDLVLPVEAGDVVRAREDDAPDAVPACRFVEMPDADDV